MKYIVFSLLFLSFSIADTVKGEFNFKKRNSQVALVYVENIKGFKSEDPSLDQLNKKFTKSVVVANPGSTVRFDNSDSVNHNIYAEDKEADVSFDVGLIEPGGKSEYKVDWDAGKVIKIRCKIHPKMKSYIANIESPYHTIVEFEKKQKSKSFELEVPKEAVEFKVWMPRYEEITMKLAPGESKTVDLIRKGKSRGTITLNREAAK